MSIPKQAGPVLVAALMCALLYSSVVAMTPEGYEAANAPEAAPTPWSADHARAQATAPDEEQAPTF
jgi:hypothetical protein